MEKRRSLSIGCPDFREPMPTTAPDLFSNDYLSITTNPHARQAFLEKVSQLPFVFGAAGSRLLTGNNNSHTDFETRMSDFFGGPGCRASTAVLFNSGYDANLSFWSTIPQKSDAVVFDELVHNSIRDGMVASPLKAAGALYPFKHNSVASFRERVQNVLETHPNIASGEGMLFVAVETLYSMEGDYAPLLQIFDAVDELIPKSSAHIMVDEAHTSSLFGPEGRGLLYALGLQARVHSVLHTHSKGWGVGGATILTSAAIRKYLMLHARPFIYTTAPPHAHVCSLHIAFDYLTGPEGSELRDRLRSLSRYFEGVLQTALRHVPPDLLSLSERKIPEDYPSEIFSPIFPLTSRSPKLLEEFLRPLGYAVTAIPYPTVPRGKEGIRVVMHAGNTEEELDEFVTRLLQWVTMMQALEEHRKENGEMIAWQSQERAKL
ncbi:PLP-dependent transferase [Lentinus tigrinus ALCF2SS1-7]|uniref:PLP-dependent transferase n=1 Tax=Lentinus tigrinus ALCF2SS1-6 TaxID=1328759 RepID=A0A5C2RW98_9APHY|nr:PLP-dependent transferase [Lentinus tigrinus ALCF2SS1-6]RPD69897.1 PLP-dependent transferase [Lentinus tigrinus ALCF2SS1-7]